MDEKQPVQEMQIKPEEQESTESTENAEKRRGPKGRGTSEDGPGRRGPRLPKGFTEVDLAIMPDFPKWRAVLYKVDYFCVGALLLIECIFYILTHYVTDVEMEMEGFSFLGDLVAPVLVSVLILVAANVLRRKLPENDMRQNAIPIFTLVFINFAVCMIHQVFLVTLSVFCAPICMTVVFSNKQMSKVVTVMSLVGASLGLVRQIFFFGDAATCMKLIPQGLIVLFVLIITGFIAQIALGMTDGQRKKLRDYATSVKEEQRRAEAANIAKSAFLANMSHEIRTPINAILGMNEMVLRENESEQIAEYAKSIHSAGSSLLSLVNDVLDISKIESGKLEIVETNYDTSSFIHDCYNMVAERAEKKGLTLNIECDPNLPCQMRGDEVRLRQVVTNLLSNAAKYTEKGSITLSVNGKQEQEQFFVTVEVKDTGIGIKEENLKTIFSQFTRFDMEKNRNIEGTGLGLAISRQLVDLMHGEITVQSIYGVGSSFAVTVPQQIMDATPMGDFNRQYRDVSREKNGYRQSFEAPDARILVVDDVEVNLKVIVNLLKATKVKVETAKSGRQCISMATQNVYDLIFLDHMMPEMDGIETYNKMKELDNYLNKDTPVIMLTANAISGVREQYLQVGFADYVSKPVSGDKLENTLLKYLPKDKILQVEEEPAKASRTAESGTLEAFKQEYPKADLAMGMSTCANNEAVYIDILQTFAKDKQVEELNSLYEQKSVENYKILTHGIKSASLCIGLTDLSQKAKELENAAKEADWEFIDKHHQAFIAEYEQVIGAIERALPW